MLVQKVVGMIAVLGLAVSVSAAPLRVAIFKGVGSGRYWHACIPQGATYMQSLLQNPTTANPGLGSNLTLAPEGIRVAIFGSNTGTPTTAEITAFMNALDTTDVVITFCNVDLGGAIGTNAAQRQKFMDHWLTKGGVSLHATTDSYGTWAALDTLQAARFISHSNIMNGRMRLDAAANTLPAYQALNASLADTTFNEEWFSFQGTSATIRAKSQLRVTTNIDETSFTPNPAMGDHPMSWYRELSAGGRFFYSAVGHRVENYQGTRFLRRTIYNAVLWAGRITPVTGIRNVKASGAFSDYSKVSVSGSALTVSLLQDGDHTVEILGLDGKRAAFEKGQGRTSHTFVNLRANSVYAVTVATWQGRSTGLVTMR